MRIGGKEFDLKKNTYIMGILNVTPDSFSDGGRYDGLDRAIEHAKQMIQEGVDIIDVGGESTRPGHVQITEEEEIARVVPVIRKLKEEFDIPVSIDTYKSAVAAAAIEAGADLVNDIWGLKYDSKMAGLIAKTGVACCLMHNRENTDYQNFLADFMDDMKECVKIAKDAGIADDRIILDPGVGFGKTYEMNLEIIDKLEFKVLDTDIDDLDITDTDEVLRFGEMNRPDIIINCAGLTNIEECENDISKAYKVNALGARNLSIIARKLEAKLVHISTDDVFDGKSDQPYNEFDQTRPQTAYGKSKLAGEQYVKEFTYKHFIIRSTWVYGLGNNFINDLLEKVNKGESLAIASDQFGSPTSAKELARSILHLIDTNEYGTYHATNKGVCSRYVFAHEILKLTGKEAQMKAVPTHLSDFSKVRPAYCVLDNFIMSMTPVYTFPSWKESLKEYFKERGLYNEK